MKTKTTVKTTIVRTRSIEITEQDVKDILLKHFDMEGGQVDFDECRQGGGINGATVSYTEREETEEGD